MSKLRAIVLSAVVIVAAACSTAPRPTTPALPDLTGTWILSTQTQMGAQDADMTVQQTGNHLAGKLSSPQGAVDYTGQLDGNAVAFEFLFGAAGQAVKIEYSGTVVGDTMSGKAKFGPLGEGTFTAKRKL